MSVTLKSFRRVPNAGDEFSRVLAERVLGPLLSSRDAHEGETELFLGGSILGFAGTRTLIAGSGLLSPHRVPPQPKWIYSVRGPLTARVLCARGIAVPDELGDPGILAPELFPQSGATTCAVGIVPHYHDKGHPWVRAAQLVGVKVIDVQADLAQVLEDISACDVVLSSSLHGLVFAHAYGRRALWIRLSDRVEGGPFKFLDYYRSLQDRPSVCESVDVTTSVDRLADLASPLDVTPLRPSVRSTIDRLQADLVAGRWS